MNNFIDKLKNKNVLLGLILLFLVVVIILNFIETPKYSFDFNCYRRCFKLDSQYKVEVPKSTGNYYTHNGKKDYILDSGRSCDMKIMGNKQIVSNVYQEKDGNCYKKSCLKSCLLKNDKYLK